MAINETTRAALIDALNEDGEADAPNVAFDAWAQSLLALNQVNSEVQAEIYAVLGGLEIEE